MALRKEVQEVQARVYGVAQMGGEAVRSRIHQQRTEGEPAVAHRGHDIGLSGLLQGIMPLDGAYGRLEPEEGIVADGLQYA